jgi:DNA-binding SARP family transcriptional activator
MCVFYVSLFGKFQLQTIGEPLYGLENKKAEELLSYLLIHRDRPHSRESLADLLWKEISISQAKSYLRKTIWQLQSGLETISGTERFRMLISDGDYWVQINPDLDLHLDVAVLENTYGKVRNRLGRELAENEIQEVEGATALYRGDLLEGWYQDWCLYERERLQYLYLALLDKLMDYCETHKLYEHGLTYGEKILRYDRARERTHRRLMRLFYFAGDRTAALRQYDKCVEALREEMEVEPAKRTSQLRLMIQNDQLREAPSQPSVENQPLTDQKDPLIKALGYLSAFQESIAKLQEQLAKDIQAVNNELKHRS